MIDKLFTPVVDGYYAVFRWDVSAQPGVMQLFTGLIANARNGTCINKRDLVPTLAIATDIKFGNRNGGDDPNVAWMYIKLAMDDISHNVNRTGGTFLVVSQTVRDWLEPHKPANMRIGWVIEEGAGINKAIITYHGYDSPDGGYPVLDHGDGTVTVFDVHDLDIQYYRTVSLDASRMLVQNQKVSLNW